MKTVTEWFRELEGWRRERCCSCGGHGMTSVTAECLLRESALQPCRAQALADSCCCRRGHRDRPQIFFASCSNRKITRWQPVVNDERAAECGGLSFPIFGLSASLSLPATLRTTQSRLLSAVDSTTRAPKRFCDRAVILLAICSWPKSVRKSIRRDRNPARQAKSRQEMWRARASTGLVLASIGRGNRPLGWMHSPRRKDPLEQPST